MKELLRPAAPSMDEPLDMLSACHERVHAQLRTLQRLAEWLPEHGADEQACQAARTIMRYFDVAAVNHHQDEEADLLPAMQAAARDADDRARVQAMRAWVLADHQQLFGNWARMREQLNAIAQGQAAELTAAQVRAFAEVYERHIEREETELLPLAARLLDAQTLQQMSHSMTDRRRT